MKKNIATIIATLSMIVCLSLFSPVYAKQISHKIIPHVSKIALAKTYSVGYIMNHRKTFLNKTVSVKGYMIKREDGYIIFSDEKIDTPNPNDLPVTGKGADALKPLQSYIITGKLLNKGLKASNKNPYHLEINALSSD